MGYTVSMPLLDSSIYDCIVDTGSKLVRVQIKSTNKKPDEHHNGVHLTINNSKREYPPELVDYFAFYTTYFDGFFVVKNLQDIKSIRLHPEGKYKNNFRNFDFVN